MAFKKMRGVRVSYNLQGKLYFTLKNIAREPKRTQERARSICEEVAGEHEAALWEFLTTDKSIVQISMEHYTSESVLYRLRRDFYARWYGKK